MSLRDQIKAILLRSKTKERLNEGRQKLLEAARERTTKPRDLSAVLSGEMHPAESEDIYSACLFERKAYLPGLEQILSELPQPPLVLLNDLADGFNRYLIVPDADFAAAYSLFAAKLLSQIEKTESDPFPVATGFVPYDEGVDHIFETLDHLRFDATICDSGSFRVVGAGIVPGAISEHKPSLHSPVFYVQVEADGTQAAVDELAKLVQGVLPSLIRSRKLLDDKRGWVQQLVSDVALPFAGTDGFPFSTEFYATCLNLSLIQATRKDSMNRRLYNAIHLLAQSDQQTHTAIALSLSCAAMEALVCRKDEDSISAMLSANTAVLLEPDPQHRQAAAKYMKRLYKKRSDALHGTKLDSEDEDRWKARAIAASLLNAVLQRRAFMTRLGEDDESPDKFFNDLERMRFRAQQDMTTTGVPHVVSFWREAEARD